MARLPGIVTIGLYVVLAISVASELHSEPPAEPGPGFANQQARLTEDQQALVDFAVGRFGEQGLQLPEIEFVFHSDLLPCSGHKGMYYAAAGVLEMCSLDENTMLHELAHAWANVHLTQNQRADFVTTRGLDSWNDHGTAWERRGTEHVAETIAWALANDPHHVKWVESTAVGSIETNYRILTIGVAVDQLLINFEELTGVEPIFRSASEWATAESREVVSPEQARLGG